MMLRDHTGGWSVVLLAAFVPGVLLQRNDSSIQPASDSELPSEAQLYRPALQPSEAVPPTGTYMLKNLAGEPCIKATMGAEYIVMEKKKSWYFSLDPSRVKISGDCGEEAAVLTLTLPGNATSLQFTFRKEKNFFYVTKLAACLSPQPACQGCANKTYSGLMDHQKLFMTAEGQSFKCKSESLLLMSSELRIKLLSLQMQAFSVPKGQYGQEVECWADYCERVVPISIGATVVGVLLIIVLTFLFIKDRRRQGYDRI